MYGTVPIMVIIKKELPCILLGSAPKPLSLSLGRTTKPTHHLITRSKQKWISSGDYHTSSGSRIWKVQNVPLETQR